MLSQSTMTVGDDKRELVTHGTLDFPFGCYLDDMVRENVPWHWHDEFDAAVVLHGKVSVTIGTDSFILSHGDGFFVNSGVLHSATRLDGDHCCMLSIVFHPRLIGGTSDTIYYKKYVLPILRCPKLQGFQFHSGTPWQKKASGFIEKAWRASVDEIEDYELDIWNALSNLLALLVHHLPSESSRKSIWSESDDIRIKKMLKFIAGDYMNEIHTADIASAANISESECLRCFHKTIGITPIQYLKNYRIEQAAQLLLSSSLSITDIAYDTGFQSPSYFIRIFRECKGSTPTEFRRDKQSPL